VEVAALPQPGDLRPDRPGARIAAAVTAAAATVHPLGVLLVIAGAAARFDIELHQALGYELHHLAQNVNIGSLVGKLGQCHSGGGHLDFLQIKADRSHLNHI
jgi:hypothetical protein